MVGQPLAGIRIVEVTHEWAGPHAGRLMADFGADVIKVEYFRRMDHMRGARKDGRIYNRHARFLQLNRNKRSLALDLKDKRDHDILCDLIRLSDVFLCNSRPGVLERLGFGYKDLVRLKPDIILVTMSASGQTGPEAHYAGYGGGIEATSGIQTLTAYSRDGVPKRIREMDVTNGIAGSAAIMTALVHRQHTGRGTWIDLSESEVPAHAFAGEHLLEFVANGESSLPKGNRDPARVPQGCYPCAGEDAWLVISVGKESEWSALCAALGSPERAGESRFADREGRWRHHDQLDAWISQWTRARTARDAMLLLQEAGVPAGVVMNAKGLHDDPHLAGRGYFQTPRESSGHSATYPGFPFRLGPGAATLGTGAPLLGQHNAEIICGLLGRPSSDVRELAEEDIGTDFDVQCPAGT